MTFLPLAGPSKPVVVCGKAGGVISGCSFLIELAGLKGVERIAKYRTISLIKYD